MKTEKLKSQIAVQIKTLEDRLGRSIQRLAHWKATVADQQRELSGLRTALAALDGQSFSVDLKNIPVTTEAEAAKNPTAWKASRPLPNGGKEAMLNGEPIILEPGFEISKNSFGEDCIVPVGTQATPMAEPVKGTNVADAISAVEDRNAGFDSPESML